MYSNHLFIWMVFFLWVAPIDHHWWSTISKYDPSSVSHDDWSTEPHDSGWVVSYLVSLFLFRAHKALKIASGGKHMNHFISYLRIGILQMFFTAWKVSKYEVFPGPHFLVFSQNTGKHGPEKTPYLYTFHVDAFSWNNQNGHEDNFFYADFWWKPTLKVLAK